MISNTNQLELFQEHLDTESDFAIYPCIQNTRARAAHKVMREVIQRLTTPFISASKDVALIGPYRLNRNGKRSNANVEAVSALIFDIDEPQGYLFEDIVNLASSYSGVLHTTWSHTQEQPRYRLIINLTSQIPSAEFENVRDAFLSSNPELELIIDKACSDISRAYYLFSYPQERADIAQCCVLMGGPVNPKNYHHPPKNALPITGNPSVTNFHNSKLDTTTLALMGRPQSPTESPAEIAKLNAALVFLSSNVGYGSGRFYDSNGSPEPDYWLAAIWAIASLGWTSGKETARNWSQTSSRYTDDGFEKAWNSYNPAHANGIGIGSLYKRAKELGWNQAIPANSINPSPQRFTLLGMDDLASLPPSEYLIKGILPSIGLAAIYGASSSGKTFLALDLIMAIACKSEWFGRRIKNVPVTYLGLEGKGGISSRIQAWRNKNIGLSPDKVKIILNNFNLMEEHQVHALANVINEAEMNHGLIIIDTLNQASPWADENGSQDMGVIIQRLQLLQASTGGLVLIVHHTGKDTRQGLRGHSSLKASLDANIEVSRNGDKRSWLLEKAKDGEDGISFPFRLEVQKLGVDNDGDPITSCTVERDLAGILVNSEPSGAQQKAALKTIKQVLSNIPNKKIPVEAAISEIAKTLTTTAPNKRTNRARQLLDSLITGSYLASELISDEGWIWLP